MEPKLLDFRYVPLSFIKTQGEIEKQSINTVVFQKVLAEFGQLKTLGELLKSTQYGYTTSAQTKGNCRFLRITDIKNGSVIWANVPHCNCENSEKYKLTPKDILIARTGNNISYLVEDNVSENAIFASYLIRLTCNQEVLIPEYLYLFLNSYAFWPQILKKQRGALLQNVNAKRMGELLIPYCPLDIQEELVSHGNKDIYQIQEKVKGLLYSQNFLSTELTHQQTLLKKLRQQILQEAIEGKLTEQWRIDNRKLKIEPASELLKRIQAEKEQLIKDKKIKKQKPPPPISEEEKPFDLPGGWVWCRLGDLLNKFSTGPFGSMLHKSDYVTNGIPLVNPANIVNGNIIPSSKMMIDIETRKRLSKYILQTGEFVIARRGDLSKCAIVSKKEEGWLCGTGSFFIQPSKYISKEYFMKFYKSYFFQKQLANTSVGQTMANLNQKILNMSLSPLPPLPEQKAIVSKVEKLLALCDQLETQITQNQTHAQQLMQAVLKEAFSQNEKAEVS